LVYLNVARESILAVNKKNLKSYFLRVFAPHWRAPHQQVSVGQHSKQVRRLYFV